MAPMHLDNAQARLRVHRLAVELYEAIVEAYGIHDQQADCALGLVQSTKLEDRVAEVYVPCSRFISDQLGD